MPRSTSSRKASKTEASATATVTAGPGVSEPPIPTQAVTAQNRNDGGASEPSDERHDPAADLSYSEAHTALELALHQLQDSNLAVESMAELYQRAQRYADRCEAVLRQVEQHVELWDPGNPDAQPNPYEP